MQDIAAIQIGQVPENMDVRAPDNTEIRLLASMHGGSAVHCTLQTRQTSLAGVHHTVEEIWYCVQGQGEVWLKRDEHEHQEMVSPGTYFTIPVQTHFQVRNTGEVPLCCIIVTMPPWPGEQEWERVADHWQTF